MVQPGQCGETLSKIVAPVLEVTADQLHRPATPATATVTGHAGASPSAAAARFAVVYFEDEGAAHAACSDADSGMLRFPHGRIRRFEPKQRRKGSISSTGSGQQLGSDQLEPTSQPASRSSSPAPSTQQPVQQQQASADGNGGAIEQPKSRRSSGIAMVPRSSPIQQLQSPELKHSGGKGGSHPKSSPSGASGSGEHVEARSLHHQQHASPDRHQQHHHASAHGYAAFSTHHHHNAGSPSHPGMANAGAASRSRSNSNAEASPSATTTPASKRGDKSKGKDDDKWLHVRDGPQSAVSNHTDGHEPGGAGTTAAASVSSTAAFSSPPPRSRRASRLTSESLAAGSPSTFAETSSPSSGPHSSSHARPPLPSSSPNQHPHTPGAHSSLSSSSTGKPPLSSSPAGGSSSTSRPGSRRSSGVQALSSSSPSQQHAAAASNAVGVDEAAAAVLSAGIADLHLLRSPISNADGIAAGSIATSADSSGLPPRRPSSLFDTAKSGATSSSSRRSSGIGAHVSSGSGPADSASGAGGGGGGVHGSASVHHSSHFAHGPETGKGFQRRRSSVDPSALTAAAASAPA